MQQDRSANRGSRPLGELPQGLYPERPRFPANTGEFVVDPQQAGGVDGVIVTARRGRAVNYPVTVIAADGAVKALSENLKRGYLFIQVKNGSSAGILYVNYGYPADVSMIEIVSPLGTYEFPWVPVDSIWLSASTGTMQVVVTEGTDL